MTRAISSIVFGVLGVCGSLSIAQAAGVPKTPLPVQAAAAVSVSAALQPSSLQLPTAGVATALSLQGVAGAEVAEEPAPAPLIPGLSAKAQKLWTAGKVLNGIGAGIGMAGSGLAGASGVITGIYGLNDTSAVGSLGPLFTQIGSGVNMGSLALNIAALGLQHGALSTAGSDPNRKKFVGGVVMGILGLGAVITGFVFAGMKDNPNASTIAFAVTSGGTSLLTTSNSIFLADAVSTAKAYKSMFAPPVLPNLSGVPGVPGMPGVPGVSGVPGVPGMPGVPDVSGLPAGAGVPAMPAMAVPQVRP